MTKKYIKRDRKVRPLCVGCGRNPSKRTGYRKDGSKVYSKYCSLCHKKHYEKFVDHRKRFRRHKGDVCERCGFVPENIRQLDIHHADGNHKNNDLDNLTTLCANCHRLEHCI